MGLRIKVSFLFALVFSCSSVFSLQQNRNQQEEALQRQPFVVFLQQPQQSSNSAPPVQSWWGVFTTTVQNNPVPVITAASAVAGTVTAAGWAAWKHWENRRWREGVRSDFASLSHHLKELRDQRQNDHAANQEQFRQLREGQGGLMEGQKINRDLLNTVLDTTVANGAASAKVSAELQEGHNRLQEGFVAHAEATGKALAAAAEAHCALGGEVHKLRGQVVANGEVAVENHKENQREFAAIRQEAADRAKGDDRNRLHQELKAEVRSRKLESDMKQGFALVSQQLAEAQKQAEKDQKARESAEERAKEAEKCAARERVALLQKLDTVQATQEQTSLALKVSEQERRDQALAVQLQFEQFGERLGGVETGQKEANDRLQAVQDGGNQVLGQLTHQGVQLGQVLNILTQGAQHSSLPAPTSLSAPTGVAVVPAATATALVVASRGQSRPSSPRALSQSPSWGLAAPLPMGFPGGTVLQIVNQRLVPDGDNNYFLGDQQHGDDQSDPFKNPWQFSVGSAFRRTHALTYNADLMNSYNHGGTMPRKRNW